MTLLIIAGNQDYVVLGSDRRFSINGKPCDDEANKAIILATDDARVTLAFTGLAFWGNFYTHRWLTELLSNATQQKNQIEFIINQIQQQASAKFRSFQGLSEDSLKLTIIVAGFIYNRVNPELRIWKISNSQNPQKKFDISIIATEDQVIVEKYGYVNIVHQKDLDIIKKMLQSNTCIKGLEAKIYHTIKKSAIKAEKTNKFVIGKQSTICRIMSDNSQIMHSTYFSDYTARTAFGANVVLGVAGGMTVFSQELAVGDDLPPVTIPITTKRNMPCPCGSGERFKNCHRLIKYPFLPLRSEISFDDINQSLPSGNKFIVETRGASVK